MISKSILDELTPVTKEEQRILDGGDTIDRTIYMNSGGNIINSKKLLSRGKLITVRPHTRFVRFPEHTHDYVEVIYMCRGSTTHIINGETIRLSEGELLFLNQHARQEVLAAGETDIAVNFIILPEFFDSALMMMGGKETPLKKFIVDSLKSSDSGTTYLYFRVSDVLPVQNLVENLLWTLIHGAPNKHKLYQSTMGLLFVELLGYTDRLACSHTEDETIMRVLRYIEENYRAGSLSELADSLHYDFCWLSREIKRRTGKNYTDLVQEKRLSQACFLLETTDMCVADIALRIGYDNISYFHRLFKKHFGMSPRSYRIK